MMDSISLLLFTLSSSDKDNTKTKIYDKCELVVESAFIPDFCAIGKDEDSCLNGDIDAFTPCTKK